MPTRREAIRKLGTVMAGAGVLSSAASATVTTTRLEALPDHVSLTYDEPWLAEYEPYLYLEDEDAEKLLGVFAFRATSPEFETDVGVFWTSYSHQEGVTNFDSHFGDHEPVYVFVDSETGDLQRVVASVYHWLAGQATATVVPTTGTHPRLRVISPWHQYTAAGDSEPTDPQGFSQLLTETDLRDADTQTEFEDWLDGGLADDLGYGTVLRPWTMLERDSWWQRGTFDLSLTESWVKLRRNLGLGESGSLNAA